ncbi:hypothetical protein [Burkholderia glumae]|uniref:hypothetical protein n=1 Tax=Burkholderia glumae TaxID=337 RepID=UPI0012965F7F|nr:hypothetical protein [Burkholderia glumae]MCM2550965.1 hypothetical protein [Burkholderia glumae]NVE26115.1 hypothetical protein [Burkholderia glumae]QGA40103.1 hypothetical protein GAS19_21270 [Burkholderia glumae]QHE12413.1 hypothetical protein GQR88_18675 [Burkholderia glumae AU6208]
MPLLSRLPSSAKSAPGLAFPTVEAWRTYLLIAALAASGAQILVLLSIAVLQIPQHHFTTPTFRCATLVYLAVAVAATRAGARFAFRAGLRRGHVRLEPAAPGTVRVSPRCPLRALVLLHLRLRREQFERVIS